MNFDLRQVIKEEIAARGGFEPPSTAPKAAVLPLDDRAKWQII